MSCQDHFSASSPTMVSMLSVFLLGSKKTRLLKQGSEGVLVATVDVSWVAKPWARSSRAMMLMVPPDFGAWPMAGVRLSAPTTARATPAATATSVGLRMLTPP